uniref:CSON011090 protein n=1 Tax=Culicoides sonorensis TaxID=179676 RepID=A0A336LMF0_CULSO
MPKKLKKKSSKIIKKLIKLTNFDLLLEICIKMEKFADKVLENVLNTDLTIYERHKCLINLLVNVGYNEFLSICRMHFPNAAILLEPDENRNTLNSENLKNNERSGAVKKSHTKVTLEPYAGVIQQKVKVKRRNRIHNSDHSEIKIYNMTEKKRGVLVFVNIIDFNDKSKYRIGAEADKASVLDLFNQFGFTLFYYENLTQMQFNGILKALSHDSNDYLKEANSLVFILSSHGRVIQDTVYVDFSDGAYCSTDSILNNFNNVNCPSLHGKPKIFLFPFRRGDKYDCGIKTVINISDDEQILGSVPTFSDIAICYGTVPGYVTHRQKDIGSWFIHAFTGVLAKYAYNTSFEDLMKIVQSKITDYSKTADGKLQTISLELRGFKKLYFNPGISVLGEVPANEVISAEKSELMKKREEPLKEVISVKDHVDIEGNYLQDGNNQMKLKSNQNHEQNEENLQLVPYKGEINYHLNVERAGRLSYAKKFNIKTYEMMKKQRGVLFLINNINFKSNSHRNGAEVDKERLLALFSQLGFQLFYYEDLGFQHFRILLKQFVVSEVLKNTDCLVFGLLTHGDDNGKHAYAEFCCGMYVNVQHIIDHFSNLNCTHLIGKPKIFLFPFCRGTLSDCGVKQSSNFEGTQALPTLSDTVICHATSPGFMSIRDPVKGGRFLQTLKMEQNDRLTILKNMQRLIDATDYELLADKCQQAKLLSNVMVKNIENDSNDTITRHKNLLKKITERGPTAFTVFKGICETDFKEAADILKFSPIDDNQKTFLSISESKRENERERREMYEGKSLSRVDAKSEPSTSNNGSSSSSSKSNGNKNENLLRLEAYDGPIQKILEVKRATRFGTVTRPGIETYSMKSKHRGVLFLVNIIDFKEKDKRRNGAESDKEVLLDLFNQMGFKLFYYENINADQFSSLIKQLSSAGCLRMADCLVFGLLTHGSLTGQTTYVEFSDGLYYPTEQIVQEFSNTNCKYLQGKPKIFLFPFCRGDRSDKGVIIYRQRSSRIETDNSAQFIEERIPTSSDIAICYATVPGFLTHRDPKEGSWYIQGLTSVFAKHAHDAPFEDLMKLVELEVGSKNTDSGAIQTSSVEYRGFSKVLYFNPGYFGDTSETETNGNVTNN